MLLDLPVTVQNMTLFKSNRDSRLSAPEVDKVSSLTNIKVASDPVLTLSKILTGHFPQQKLPETLKSRKIIDIHFPGFNDPLPYDRN